MKKIDLSLTVSLALLPWVAMAAPEPQAVELLGKVSGTLGADTLKSVEFSGAGHSYTLGQGGSVTAPWPKSTMCRTSAPSVSSRGLRS